MALKDFLIEAVAGTIESVAESKLVDVLQKLHASNPEAYWAAIHGGKALCEALKPVVAGTATKIDDAIIAALHDALNTSEVLNTPVTQAVADEPTDPNQPPPPGGPGHN